MAEESLFMLYSFLMGIFITFVYDLLRILRRVIPHNLFWISLEDLVFWGFCAVEVFLLMYHVSNGTLRWFAVLGALGGIIIYNRTISRFLVKYISLFLCKVVAGIGRALRFLFRPVRAVADKASCGRKSFFTFMKNKLTAVKKVLTMVICKK